MKLNINLKSMLAGILIGASVMGTASVFGSLIPNRLVEAWIQDSTHKILVDGRLLDLGEDNHILNYQGRIYTPARLVSEAVGAEVRWEEASNSVIIRSPEPEIREIIVEKEVVVDPDKAETRPYEEIPTRTTKSNITFRVVDTARHSNDFEVVVTIENDSSNHIYPNIQEMYLEDSEGNVYKPKLNGTERLYVEGIRPRESAERVPLYFEEIPRDVKNLKIFIPMEYEIQSGFSFTKEVVTFTTYFETKY